MNEPTTINKLIRQLLKIDLFTNGDATFNTQIGNHTIDLIFENNNEIWIILAKAILDYAVLEEILLYKKICIEKNILSKDLRLGIVCEIADPAILPSFTAHNIEIFNMSERVTSNKNFQKIETQNLKEKNEEEKDKNEVCGICGGPILRDNKGHSICKTIRLHLL